MENIWCLLLLSGIVFSTGLVRGENRRPQWQHTLREALHITGIREDVQTGSPIGVLSASDADGDQVTYSTNSDYFSVDTTTGKVTLSSALDREVNTDVSVTFRATDGKSDPVEITYTVKVLDVNDNSPVFANQPYSTVVAENTPVGAEVFTSIRVTDKDSGVNAAITLSCYAPSDNREAIAACETFKVNQQHVSEGVYTGSLALKHSVQYKTKSKYTLILQAVDQGSTPRETLEYVEITVRDTQDDPPEFLYTPLSLVIYENVRVGSSVGELKARDQDVGSPNPLQLSIVADPSGLFTLGESVMKDDSVVTTVIKTRREIDREQVGSNYEFTVEAVEVVGGRPSTSNDQKVRATVKVLVRDKNDESPAFNKHVYDITIDENLARGRTLPDLDLIVKDNDLVENAYFELRILNEDARKIFALSPTNGTRSAAVSIVVLEPRFLDYEHPEYRNRVIELMATETRTKEQHSTRATVNIHLRDVNDNSPTFAQTSYTTSVSENRPVGHLIRTITATDSDSGVFKQITYSLVGTLSEKFHIDSRRGIVTLAEKLDYESETVISLMFTATDGGGRTSRVPFEVNVLDYNDQGPVFDTDHYQTFVDESSTQMSPNITIHAVDVDSDRDVTYRIQSGNTPDNAFVINSKTGFFSLKHTIDYRDTPDHQGFFPVIVEASDNDRPPVTATTTVVVTVRDENNHAPVFRNARYTSTVSEISPPGTSVAQVNATDLDFNNNGEIGFVLYSGSRDNFAVNYYTGLVKVAPRANLDIERFGRQYTMIVNAIDNGSPPRTGTATVSVTVTDSNNKLPTFPRALYTWRVQETVHVGSLINTLTATDPDAGARLEYHIKSDSFTAKDKNGNPVTSTTPFNYETAFTVEPMSGAVKTHSALNRDQVAEVSFIVRATDKNAEDPPLQIGSATVIITILQNKATDIVFQRPWSPDHREFKKLVPEGEPTGPSNVILRLVATDPRTGQQLRHFREVANSDPNDYFSVTPDTGEIYINKVLDYETMPNKHISFEVEAFTNDTGSGRRSAIAKVSVEVIDVNDNSPRFKDSPQFTDNAYQMDVSELSRYPTEFNFVEAEDKDSGSFGTITYSLSGPDAHMFVIDPVKGAVMVAPNVTLDRETTPVYTLTVNATDNVNGPGIKRSTVVSLLIRVTDANDNYPRFDESRYEASALESLGSDKSLVRVHAVDTDTGNNGQITYTVVGGGEGLFYIKKGTDVIVTKTPLAGHARESPYVLTVEARDGGVPPQATTTTVVVFVNTMQTADGKPRLEFPPHDGYYINVTEFPQATNVTHIRAHSGIPGAPPLTYYFFVGSKKVQDSGPFHIDTNTGLITTTRGIDREKHPLYKLTIVVEGQGNPPKKTIRRIFINLKDADDNLPSFRSCPASLAGPNPIEWHVDENVQTRERVGRVTACDSDSPPYNVIHYFITEGNLDPNNKTAFTINMMSGEIWMEIPLDREAKERYILKVEARNGTTPQSRRRRDVDPGNVITVVIIVDDKDDNKPQFAATGSSGSPDVTAGVMALAPYGSQIVRLYAVDQDQSKNAANKYSLSKIVFHKSDSESRSVPEAFIIEESTGIVRTKEASYLDFVYGYFTMDVSVTGPDGTDPSQVTLYLYVVRSNQRLRFIFNDTPEVVRKPENGPTFASQMGSQVTGWKIYTDTPHYHVEKDAEVNFDKTDLCFHVVKANEVVNPDEALRTIRRIESDTEVTELYQKYSVEGVGLCEVKVTTRWWSGYWYLWWILIAFALFILLVSLILICCICCPCCYCYTSAKDRPYKYRPSIIVEPVSHAASAPIVVTSTARTVPNDAFEWQENIVTMD